MADAMADKLAALRRNFDERFALREEEDGGDDGVDLLFVACGSRVVALPSANLVDVLPLTPPTPVPRPTRALCGLSAVRGEALPVFALEALLSGEPIDPARRWAWLVTVPARESAQEDGRSTLLGLAVDGIEGLGRIPALEPATTGWTRGVVSRGGALRQVIDLAGLVEDLTRRPHISPPALSSKEP